MNSKISSLMKPFRLSRILLQLVLAFATGRPATCLAAAPASTSGNIDFGRDIAPIFIKRCIECHGPDQQKSKLRLDNKADAFRGGKSHKPAIVPGKSSESEIIRRVTTTDPDDVMPNKGERLTPEQIALLKSWIDQG